MNVLGKKLVLFIISIGILFSIIRISAHASYAVTPGPTDFLQAQGKDLIYKGNPVVLKGTNFDNVPALGAGIGTGSVNDIIINAADYANVKAQGGNHIRFNLSFNWYKDNPTTFFSTLDQHISWARNNNLWMILNMATTPANCYEGYSNVCAIWTNVPEQNELQDFWVEMATRYKQEPVIAGYGLLNEPYPQGPNYCATWFGIAGTIRNAVYAIAPNQLVFIAACGDPGNDLLYSNPPTGTNIVYEVHDYTPVQMTHDFDLPYSTYPGTATDWFATCTYNKNVFAGTPEPGDPVGCTAQLTGIREKYGINWANANNYPIYVGEWGTTSKLIGADQFTMDKAELYRDWGVNHAHYTWKHQTIGTGGYYQWGIYSPSGTMDDQNKLDAVKVSWTGAVFADFPVFMIPTPTPVPTSTPGSTPSLTPTLQSTITLPNTAIVDNPDTAVYLGVVLCITGVIALLWRYRSRAG